MKKLKYILPLALILSSSFAQAKISDEKAAKIANAIFQAEGGTNTAHPYGILTKYKHTTPRQACLNTIRHQHANWEAAGSHGDFIEFLGAAYCPVGAKNDPKNLNKNWVPNVKSFLK